MGKVMDKEFLKRAAKRVELELPDGYGFVLLASPFGDGEHRLVYTSNIQREDAIALLKEFLINAGAAEDWMKHLP